ncbi:MAG TPA: hypothetical protein EYO61_01030 [Campylobacterales bacterium]|nr:hypothetical protein [Campylobacterales bacterium]HIO71272.1 hypothetical protein [Campylobacterales bacterium]
MRFLIAILLLSGGAYLYLYFNPSYKLSMEAKIYYSMGEYRIALELANQALELRSYNTMAFHIKTRSEEALKIINYIEEADKYQQEIIEILKERPISKENKYRIKMMSDIVIGNYEALSMTFVEDEKLKEEALKRYQKFQKLNRNIVESIEKEENRLSSDY